MISHHWQLWPQAWNRQFSRMEFVRPLFKRLDAKPRHIVIPLVLSVAVALLEGVGIGLLAPLASGVVAGDFSIVTGHPIFQSIASYVPALGHLEQWRFSTTFAFFAGLVFTVNIARMACDYTNRVYGKHLQALFRMRLQNAVYDQLFSFGKHFFDTVSQGYLRTYIQYAHESVAIIDIARLFLQTLLRIVAYLSVLVLLSWKITLIVAVVAPLLHYSVKTLVQSVRQLHRKATKVWMEKSKEAYNTLSAMPLVWSYSQEDKARASFAKLNEDIRKMEHKSAYVGELAIYVQEAIILTALLGIIIYMAVSSTVLEQPGQIASLLVFLYVAQRTLPMLNSVTRFRVGLAEQGPKLEHVLTLFNKRDVHTVQGGNKIFPGIYEELRFQNLSFAYHTGVAALQDVSFICRRGTTTALVGASGAGKSTIASLIMRYYECPPSSIQIDGQDIRIFTLSSLRKRMAHVSQDTYLIHDTLQRNITYGLAHVSAPQLTAAIRDARLQDVVTRLPDGLDTEIGDRGVQLSGGERQRVAIARALLKGADIILLDEATSALDSKTEAEVHAALETVMEGRTSIIIAHRLATVRGADQVVYLESGRVKEVGTFTELAHAGGAFYEQLMSQNLLVDDFTRSSHHSSSPV